MRQLHLGVNMYNSGIHAAAWRTRDDPFAYLDIDYYRDITRIAERGTLDAVFLADIPGLREDPRVRPTLGLEPTVLLTGIASATTHIGLAATASTTFKRPVQPGAQVLLAGPHQPGPGGVERRHHLRPRGGPELRAS